MYKFPNEFLWGASLSGPQTEGEKNKANRSVWDTWFDQEPDRFYNNISPKVTCDTYNRFKEDVKLMSDISFNSVRTSIQWTRLIKDFETGEVCEDGARFYREYFEEMIKNNIEPIINLYHFDMPDVLMQKYGGFESKHVVDLFVVYAKTAFALYGDIVKKWVTMNEPIVPIEFGYFYDAHRPNIVDPKLGIQAGYNTLLAHSKTVKAYRDGKFDGEIGAILNLTPAYPRSQNEKDVQAALDCDAIFNKSFMDPITLGKFNPRVTQMLIENELMPITTAEEREIIKSSNVDFIGLNYYVPRRVKARLTMVDKQNPWMPDWYYEDYEMPGCRNNPHRANNEIYPKAIYDIAMDVKNNYNNIPWYLSEIGISMTNEDDIKEGKTINDTFRTELLKEHLVYLHKAIEEGSNCFGLHQWTFIDNWSWLNTHKRRYGFYYLDLNTGERILKNHGTWFKTLIENNGF